MQGQLKIFRVGSHQFRESLRELLREFWFSCCSSREMSFREGISYSENQFPNSQSCSKNTPELSESFHSESVFPEIGVVPGFPWSHKPMSLNGRLWNSEEGARKSANPSPTLRQPFANLSPTFHQPFPNLFCQPSPTPSLRGPQAPV